MLGTPPQPTDVVKRLHQLTAVQEGKKLKQQHEPKIQAPAQATKTTGSPGKRTGSAPGICTGSALAVSLQGPLAGQPITVTKLPPQCPIPEIWAFVSKEPPFRLDFSSAFT